MKYKDFAKYAEKGKCENCKREKIVIVSIFTINGAYKFVCKKCLKKELKRLDKPMWSNQ